MRSQFSLSGGVTVDSKSTGPVLNNGLWRWVSISWTNLVVPSILRGCRLGPIYWDDKPNSTERVVFLFWCTSSSAL